MAGGSQTERHYGFDITFGSRGSLDYLLKEIFLDRIYYFDLRAEGPVIFDLGANIGIATLFFKKTYPEATVYCFEPNPEVFGFLKHNVEANNLTNVHPVNAGLMDFTGRATLHKPGWSDGSSTFMPEKLQIEEGHAKNHFPAEDMDIAREEVDVLSLKEFIKEKGIGRIDLLKIDVEGAESAIISDIAPILGTVDFINMEYHYARRFVDINPLSGIVSALERAGFIVSLKPLWKTNKPEIMCTYIIRAINGRHEHLETYDLGG